MKGRVGGLTERGAYQLSSPEKGDVLGGEGLFERGGLIEDLRYMKKERRKIHGKKGETSISQRQKLNRPRISAPWQCGPRFWTKQKISHPFPHCKMHNLVDILVPTPGQNNR